jgi:hypothetical protein
MQVLNQLIQFVQQGIGAIFKLVQLVWTWSTGQIMHIFQSPWQSWPLSKQIVLVVVAAGVIWALYKAAKELWEASEKTLVAFAGLLSVFVKTLPHIVLAGVIALGGIWVLNSINFRF